MTTAASPGATRAGREVVQAGEHRLARVESLRALAALGVAAGHAWGIAHGYRFAETLGGGYFARAVFGGGFGVYLFFALSGYLLFWPFARSRWGGGAMIDLRRYAINRAVRILPLYYTAVVLLLLIQERGGSRTLWWHFLLFWENFSSATFAKVDGVLWSLVVEVHFYVLLPLLVVALARVAADSRARVAALLLLIGAASWVLRVEPGNNTPNGSNLWTHNLPATFCFFVPGMLLAVLRLEWEARPPRALAGRLGGSGLWLAASAVLWLVIFARYSLEYLAMPASFLAVGACVLPLRESVARRALDWPPLVAVGVASYSVYVWHERVLTHLEAWGPFPGGTIVLFAVGIPLSLLAAFASYKVIEQPWLRLRRRWSAASAPIERGVSS